MAELKSGLLNAPAPSILNVPLVIVRKPAVFAPRTVRVPPGLKLKTGVLLVPLFRVMPTVCFRSVVLAPPNVAVASVAPVNTMPAAAVLPLVLKSIVPLLVRFAPMDRTWPVCVPAGWIGIFRRELMVTDVDQPSKFWRVVASNCRIPPLATVTLKALLESIVTVCPEAIVTLSPAPGTTPPTQVAGALQFPPAAES